MPMRSVLRVLILIKALAIHGKHFLLRDLKTRTETEFDKIPGFYGAFETLHESRDKNEHFLSEGSLRIFGLHLNSIA